MITPFSFFNGIIGAILVGDYSYMLNFLQCLMILSGVPHY